MNSITQSDWTVAYARIDAANREDARNGITVSKRVTITTDGMTCVPMTVGCYGLVAYGSGQAVYEVV